MTVSASIIVPSHNRPAAVAITVKHLLASASPAEAEVLVVDDGSTPPLALPLCSRLRVVRTSGVERSRARNLGACHAEGTLLIFVDDDITVAPDFVDRHLRASMEFGAVLSVGRISLPKELLESPFGRFRRTIEEPSQARPRGFVNEENFCTAANMSIQRNDFLSLGGFDPVILSAEDQDLALRFSGGGGRIVFLPEAEVIHRDSVDDIAAYARRHEWGARAMAPFLRRHPARPENRQRIRLGDPLLRSARSGRGLGIPTRMVLSNSSALAVLRTVIEAGERLGVGDRWLFPLYGKLLGLHLFRGFRKGLAQTISPPALPTPLTPSNERRQNTY